MVARIANVTTAYAVVVVDKKNKTEVYKTTDHAKMMAQVRQAAAEQKQYKVLRQAL